MDTHLYRFKEMNKYQRGGEYGPGRDRDDRQALRAGPMFRVVGGHRIVQRAHADPYQCPRLQVRQTSGLGQDTKLPGMGLPSGSRWVLACSNVMLGMYHVPMQTKGKQIQLLQILVLSPIRT